MVVSRGVPQGLVLGPIPLPPFVIALSKQYQQKNDELEVTIYERTSVSVQWFRSNRLHWNGDKTNIIY
ncbi:hypothetical protein J6590_027968 [Homalodisca vitripennis]|nr:hypothetical protein J6590_027968 [Homalodisca vitripennis]